VSRDLLEAPQNLAEVLGMELDENTRTIYLFEEINAALMRRLVPALYRMADESEEDNILLVAGSLGGSDMCMFALVDLIQSLEPPIDILALGALSSAASGLLAVCDHRTVGEHTEVCLHGFTASLGEGDYDYRELCAAVQRMQGASHRYARLLSQRSQLTYMTLLAITRAEAREMRLIGEAIVELGLADEVLRPAHVSAQTA
jgi:ATP-dependent protease ClpP protease subunit